MLHRKFCTIWPITCWESELRIKSTFVIVLKPFKLWLLHWNSYKMWRRLMTISSTFHGVTHSYSSTLITLLLKIRTVYEHRCPDLLSRQMILYGSKIQAWPNYGWVHLDSTIWRDVNLKILLLLQIIDSHSSDLQNR